MDGRQTDYRRRRLSPTPPTRFGLGGRGFFKSVDFLAAGGSLPLRLHRISLFAKAGVQDRRDGKIESGANFSIGALSQGKLDAVRLNFLPFFFPPSRSLLLFPFSSRDLQLRDLRDGADHHLLRLGRRRAILGQAQEVPKEPEGTGATNNLPRIHTKPFKNTFNFCRMPRWAATAAAAPGWLPRPCLWRWSPSRWCGPRPPEEARTRRGTCSRGPEGTHTGAGGTGEIIT